MPISAGPGRRFAFGVHGPGVCGVIGPRYPARELPPGRTGIGLHTGETALAQWPSQNA